MVNLNICTVAKQLNNCAPVHSYRCSPGQGRQAARMWPVAGAPCPRRRSARGTLSKGPRRTRCTRLRPRRPSSGRTSGAGRVCARAWRRRAARGHSCTVHVDLVAGHVAACVHALYQQVPVHGVHLGPGAARYRQTSRRNDGMCLALRPAAPPAWWPWRSHSRACRQP